MKRRRCRAAVSGAPLRTARESRGLEKRLSVQRGATNTCPMEVRSCLASFRRSHPARPQREEAGVPNQQQQLSQRGATGRGDGPAQLTAEGGAPEQRA